MVYRWFGNEYPFLSWMSQLGIPTQGGADGVTVVKQGFNVDPLIQKQADCISTMPASACAPRYTKMPMKIRNGL